MPSVERPRRRSIVLWRREKSLTKTDPPTLDDRESRDPNNAGDQRRQTNLHPYPRLRWGAAPAGGIVRLLHGVRADRQDREKGDPPYQDVEHDAGDPVHRGVTWRGAPP